MQQMRAILVVSLVQISETQSLKVLSLPYNASIYQLKMMQKLELFEFQTFVTPASVDNRRTTF
jgi:hypothetical protein